MRHRDSVDRMWRLARDLGPFLRRPISPESAEAIVDRRLEERETRFLKIAESHIYSHPGSPYRSLLEMAGCELEDLERLVTREGLDTALGTLLEAGVYVTYDEFKGRRPAVRGSREFHFAESDFDNPRVAPHFILRTGGSRGKASAVRLSFDSIADMAASTLLMLQVHGLDDYDHAIWILPLGLSFALRFSKMGRPPVAWFYPAQLTSPSINAGSLGLAAASRLLGVALPSPTHLDLQDVGGMIDWLEQWRRKGRSICVTSYASAAVRVSLAAQEKGVSLSHVCFFALGEPVTESKTRLIEGSGARLVGFYGITEAGSIGFSCAERRASDDIHLQEDAFGLIQRRRQVGDGDVWVDAFALTSLLASAPKILFNTETGDYGHVERRACGCDFENHGLKTHLSGIRSFEKLSSEGMTFAQVDLLQLLEDTLPREFGGSAADYQVVEEEGENGLQRVLLVISPQVGELDEARVRARFLQELAGPGVLESTGAELWRKANTLGIVRRQPIATDAGKVQPFHIRR